MGSALWGAWAGLGRAWGRGRREAQAGELNYDLWLKRQNSSNSEVEFRCLKIVPQYFGKLYHPGSCGDCSAIVYLMYLNV